jgi:DNA-binding NarL/FixJ family response regulator
MQILLIGRPNSITSTLASMLESHEQWELTIITSAQGTIPSTDSKENYYKLLIANLAGFNQTPNRVVSDLKTCFPSIPLLVLYSYENPLMIQPILNAGADGYLQNGHSEEDVFEAARTVASGNRYIKPNFTYSQ